MKKDASIQPSDITPKEVFEQRRQWIKLAAAGAFGVANAEFFGRQAFADRKSVV